MPWIVYAGAVETSALVSEALLMINDISTVYSFKSSGVRPYFDLSSTILNIKY